MASIQKYLSKVLLGGGPLRLSKPNRSIANYCCFIDQDSGNECPIPAEWQVWAFPYGPDDNTEVCTDHVGHLLTDAPEHIIYHMKVSEAV